MASEEFVLRGGPGWARRERSEAINQIQQETLSKNTEQTPSIKGLFRRIKDDKTSGVRQRRSSAIESPTYGSPQSQLKSRSKHGPERYFIVNPRAHIDFVLKEHRYKPVGKIVAKGVSL